MTIKDKIIQWNSFSTINDMETKTMSENMISKTFLWVWIILLITFGTWYFSYTQYISWAWNIDNFFILSILWMIIWFILIRKIAVSWQKISYNTLASMFVLFWILEWFSLSSIFFTYGLNSITQALLTTSVMFLVLSIIWYWLKKDITNITSILIAWLFALIISSLINMFWQNWTFDLVINVIWIIIFSVLVIVDIQWLKKASMIWDKRMEIVMWLSLFLDFINIFLFLLRMFGTEE